MRMSDTAGHSQHLKNTCHLVGRRLQRLLGAAAAVSVGVGVVPRQISDASRFGQSPALHGGRRARAGLPAVHTGVGGAAAKGRAPGRHEEWTGGRDQVWWQQQLPAALGWLPRA